MKHILASLALAITFIGCAGSDFEWDRVRQVKLGMTEQEVTALLGPPTAVGASSGGVKWAWVHVNTLAGSSRTVSVVFREGVVVSVPPLPDSFK